MAGPIEFRFTPTSPVSVRLARRVVANWLEAHPSVDGDGFDELLVAVSELCTNAATHASGDVGSVAIRVRFENAAVILEVEDDGPGFDPDEVIDLTRIESYDEHGRGLFIVKSLVDEMTVDHVHGRTVVACSKDGIIRT
ncbi:MAG TPA: ATP-binding protein [Acidimicrobiales bacterium]